MRSIRFYASLFISMLLLLSANAPTYAVDAATLPVSKGVYRLPYDNGTSVRFSNAHDSHPTTLNRTDMTGQGNGPFTVVAAGAGVIRRIQDENNTFCPNSGINDVNSPTAQQHQQAQNAVCNGYNGPSASCCERDNPACNASCLNNFIWIEHPNGEWSKYTHIRRNSADNLGRFEGESVNAGDEIGIEGDVGIASGPHVHFEVAVPNHVENAPPNDVEADPDSPPDVYSDWFTATGFIRGDGDPGTIVNTGDGTTAIDYNRQNRIPIFCQVGFATAGDINDAGNCDDLCGFQSFVLGGTISDGEIFYRQTAVGVGNDNNNLTIETGGGASVRGGSIVRLTPGFHAEPNSFFAASIGGCDTPGGS